MNASNNAHDNRQAATPLLLIKGHRYLVTAEISAGYIRTLSSCRTRTLTQAYAKLPHRLPTNQALLARACTHKIEDSSAIAIDVRLPPTSGAKADIA
jgi:hypothetical protein